MGEAVIRTPKKKPKNQELTIKEKSQNKVLASEIIFVEHIIRLLKIFRVIQERFRLNPEKYVQIIKTICGLGAITNRYIPKCSIKPTLIETSIIELI